MSLEEDAARLNTERAQAAADAKEAARLALEAADRERAVLAREFTTWLVEHNIQPVPLHGYSGREYKADWDNTYYPIPNGTVIWDGWVFRVSGGEVALVVGQDFFWRISDFQHGRYYAETYPGDLPPAEALRPHIVEYIAEHQRRP